jgi:hypothetical protein
MSLASLTSSGTLFMKYFERYVPASWFDFYSRHRFVINTSAAVTFLGFISYAVYRFFFGGNRRPRTNSSSDEDEAVK